MKYVINTDSVSRVPSSITMIVGLKKKHQVLRYSYCFINALFSNNKPRIIFNLFSTFSLAHTRP